MRNIHQPHPPRIPARTRLLAVALALALAVCLGLPTMRAEAGPPKKSDERNLKLKKAQCTTKIIRRDSFRGALYYDEGECEDWGLLTFKLPSGQTASLQVPNVDVGCDKLKRWYGGSKQGKMVTVHYVVRRSWGIHGIDDGPDGCVLKPELLPPRQ